ncbi:hypothetical protein AFEL58S_02057 [Afipia felis]
MSIATMNWALRQRLESPHHQCLLYVIADSADPDGVTKHCASEYLVRHARMSRATVFRKLADLRELGLLQTFSSHGDRGSHIYEIRLNLDKIVDVPLKSRKTADDDAESHCETHVCGETGVSERDSVGLTGETGTVAPVRLGESHSGDCISPPMSKDSPPNPPPGGCVSDCENGNGQVEPVHFAEFRRDYPMPSMWNWQKAIAVFAALTPAEAEHARAAAPLYARQCAMPKAPKPRRPDMWLRDRMFENFKDAKLPPPEAERVFIAEGSDDFTAMCVVASMLDRPEPRATGIPGFGMGVLRGGALPPDYVALHRFAATVRESWFVAEANSPEFMAWARRLHDWTGRHVEARIVMLEGTTTLEIPGSKSIEVRRRTNGLRVPCRWPPRKDGTICDDNGGEGEQDA